MRDAPIADSLGARVRAARHERGLSQAQLAGEELTKGFISQLESGLVRPSIRSLQVLANRLGKPLDYFLADGAISVHKRLEFFQLAAEAAAERRAWDELAATAEDALRLDLAPADRGRFLRWLAHARWGRGEREEALATAEEALRWIDESSDPAAVAWALWIQGGVYQDLGQVAASAQIHERALAIVDAQEVLDARLRARLLIGLGTAYRRLNRTTKAVQAYESALAMANRHSDLRMIAMGFMGMAVALYDSGELDGAIVNYRRALELFQRIADQDWELSVMHSLAAVHNEQGQTAEAERVAGQCRERAQAVGAEYWVAVAEVELARVALARGEAQQALASATGAERTLARLGDRRQRPWALWTIAIAQDALADFAASDTSYRRAVDLALEIELYPEVSQFAADYARKLRVRGEYERAFEYLELARKHAGTPSRTTDG